MKTKQFFYYLIISVIVLSNACQRGPYPGYEKTETGMYYKISRGNSDKQLPAEGDVLTVDLSYYLQENDSLLFTSFNSNEPVILPIQKPRFKGDINEGLLMITEGDSGSFIIKADSFLIYNVGMTQMPPYVTSESMFRFEIKVLNHKTSAEFMAEQKLMQEKRDAQMAELKQQEPIDRDAWLKENNITVKPTQSGLYFIQIKAGTGQKVESGDLIKAHYTGYLLNGQQFDSSVGSAEPFSFVAGRGDVIPGWDEAVMMMREGGKAKIILPSELAYGESRPDFPIPPYATLIFELEIVGIEKTSQKRQ
jgi:FKBP-type peptidyl-prolyl cis-trans isomerase FkpA